jgi:flagellar motility protein MotE (MotC chaperone)
LWCFIFILGGAAGWFGNCIYRGEKNIRTAGGAGDSGSKKDDDKDGELQKIIADLVRELHLDAEQQESLKNIFFETRLEYQELNKEFRPRYKTIRDESDDKIRKILRDGQRERFEEILKPFRSQKSAAIMKSLSAADGYAE